MSTDMIWQTRSIGSEDTESLGEQLGKLLKNQLVIEMRSDLGGGKTTFVRGLAKGLGYHGNVSSPTFTISREYQGQKGFKLYHFDFYRLADAGIVSDQLAEAISNTKAVVAVEWSDVVQNVLPDERLTIIFEPVADNPDERLISIHYIQSLEKLVKQLASSRETIKP